MKNISILTFLLILPAQFLPAQDVPSADTFTQEVMNNVCEEDATCVAYFYIAREVVERTKDTSTAIEFETAAENAMSYDYMSFLETGVNKEFANRVVTTRINLALEQMSEEIEDITNISILRDKYMDRFKKAMDAPTWIMFSGAKKIGEKYGTISSSDFIYHKMSQDEAAAIRSKYKVLVNDPAYWDHFNQVAIDKGLSIDDASKYSDCMVIAGNLIINETSDLHISKFMGPEGGQRLGMETALDCVHILKSSSDTNQK